MHRHTVCTYIVHMWLVPKSGLSNWQLMDCMQPMRGWTEAPRYYSHYCSRGCLQWSLWNPTPSSSFCFLPLHIQGAQSSDPGSSMRQRSLHGTRTFRCLTWQGSEGRGVWKSPRGRGYVARKTMCCGGMQQGRPHRGAKGTGKPVQ